MNKEKGLERLSDKDYLWLKERFEYVGYNRDSKGSKKSGYHHTVTLKCKSCGELVNRRIDRLHTECQNRQCAAYYLYNLERKAHSEEAMFKKYGVRNGYLTDKAKATAKYKQAKIRQDNIFYLTKGELKAYNKLKEKFKVVHTNYSSDVRYPTQVDLYIEDIDQFIELNYHWTHMGERFISSDEQLKKLESLKDKPYYNQVKHVWTELDVNKFIIAERNNLNYLAFYSEEQFNAWYYNLV